MYSDKRNFICMNEQKKGINSIVFSIKGKKIGDYIHFTEQSPHTKTAILKKINY